MRVLTFALVMLISGCVTAPPLTSHFLNQRPVRLVNEADFISQKRNHCGPATLTMSAQRYTSDVSLSEVTSLAFTPGANGSFKGDMLSAARRIGLAAYSIPSPERMIEFVQAGHSVLLFQDLGALWIRVWHFALLLGYDTRNKTFILHSGPDAYKENSAREVLRTWERGGKWSFALVPAGVIPNGVSHEEALANAMALMAVGHQRGHWSFTRSCLSYGQTNMNLMPVWLKCTLVKISSHKLRFTCAKPLPFPPYTQGSSLI